MKIKEVIKEFLNKWFGRGPDGKTNPHQLTLLTGIIGLPIAVILHLQLGYEMGNNPRTALLPNLLNAINNFGNFKRLYANDSYYVWHYNFQYSWMIFLAYAGAVFAMYINNERMKRLDRNSKGNEKWNDWKWHNMNRVYPKGKRIISEPEENSDKIGNAILGEKTRLNMEEVYGMNLNMLIQGSPGSGKTRYVLKPNLLQFNSSYVITDPSGELIRASGKALMEHGYRVKLFNLDDMSFSCQYNPFRYIKSDDEVLTLVDCMMKNTDDSKANKGDQFFTKAEQCLFLSIFYYIIHEYKDQPEKQNLNEVMRMLLMAKVSEQKEDLESDLDRMFNKLPPEHIAVKNYTIFKQGTGKTLKSILISAGVRMAPFNIPGVIIQSLGQLKQMYDKDYTSIIDGCSTQMYLAIQDADDLKRVSELLGNKTVDVKNTSRSFGSKGSDSQSFNTDSTALMTASQIRRMDTEKCLIFISSEAPFLDNKYDLKKHPNFSQLGEKEHPENYFNFREYFFIVQKKTEEEKQKMDQTFRRSEQMVQKKYTGRKKMTIVAGGRSAAEVKSQVENNKEVVSEEEIAATMEEMVENVKGMLDNSVGSKHMKKTLEKQIKYGKIKQGKNGIIHVEQDEVDDRFGDHEENTVLDPEADPMAAYMG